MRMLLIGPDRAGHILEVVIVRPYTDEESLIHAMRPARPSFIKQVMPHD